jgi:hypothetical protein
VLITVPLLPASLGAVSFRLTKICGGFVAHSDTEWTVSSALAVGAMLLLAGAAVFRGRQLRLLAERFVAKI